MRKKQTQKRKHTGSFVLGFILLAFAVFGIFEAVSLTVNKISDAREGSSKFVEYEQFLEPFVVIDPTPFDDISSAEPTDLLDAAISAMIYDGETMNTYDVFEGEVTGLLVPQGDVEAYFVRLFGTEIQMTHGGVSDSFYNVVYNSEKKAYIIPITSVDPVYTPKVYDMERTGSSVTLTVGYIIGSEWAQLEHGKYTAPEPAKYMKITLREDNDGYHIGSLRSSETAQTVDPAKTTAPSTTAAAPIRSTTLPPEDESVTATESAAGETTDESTQTP